MKGAVRKAVARLSAAEIVVALVGLLNTLVLTRVLGVADYGLAVLAVASAELGGNLLNLSLGDLLTTFSRSRGSGAAGVDQVELDGILAYALRLEVLSLAGGGLLSLALVVLTIPTGATRSLALVLAGLSLARLPVRLSIAVGALDNRYTFLSTIRSLVASIRAGGSIIAAIVWGPAGVVLGVIGGTLVESVLSLHLLRARGGRRAPLPLRRPISPQRKVAAARFVRGNVLNNIVANTYKEADLPLLGLVASTSTVGLYKVAARLVLALGLFLSPLRTVLTRELSLLPARQEVLRRTTHNLVARLIPASVAVGIGGILVAPWLVQLVGGDDFRAAVGPARVLMLGVSLSLAFAWLRPLAVALKRPGILVATSVTTGLIAVVGYVIFLPDGGAMTLATVKVIAQGTAAVVATGLARRALGRSRWGEASFFEASPVPNEDVTEPNPGKAP